MEKEIPVSSRLAQGIPSETDQSNQSSNQVIGNTVQVENVNQKESQLPVQTPINQNSKSASTSKPVAKVEPVQQRQSESERESETSSKLDLVSDLKRGCLLT